MLYMKLYVKYNFFNFIFGGEMLLYIVVLGSVIRVDFKVLFCIKFIVFRGLVLFLGYYSNRGYILR